MREYKIIQTDPTHWTVGQPTEGDDGAVDHVLLTLQLVTRFEERRLEIALRLVDPFCITLHPYPTALYRLLEQMPGEVVVVSFDKDEDDTLCYYTFSEMAGEGLIFERDWSQKKPGMLVMTVTVMSRHISVLLNRDELLKTLEEIQAESI